MTPEERNLQRRERETTLTKHRESNIELFRIVMMLLIVAHHYVANSGLLAVDGPIYADPLSWRSLFLLVLGAWGKIGINGFVMITGYFMCRSKITLAKFCKLLFEVMFYKIVIAAVFWCTGYETFSLKGLVKAVLPITSLDTGFTGAFLVFFLFIPFVTLLVQHLNERQHLRLLLLCFVTHVILATIPKFSFAMNYVSWFILLFFFASYIRLYPKKLFESAKLWGWLSLACVVLCTASVVACTWIAARFKLDYVEYSYFFVMDSNKLLAFITGLCFFLFSKNVRIGYSRVVNRVAMSTFGVLLIHANSNTMRQWLWKDVCNNVGWYSSPWMVLHAVGSVVAIFLICIGIDQLRILLLERPLFRLLDRCWGPLADRYGRFSDKLMQKIETKQQ